MMTKNEERKFIEAMTKRLQWYEDCMDKLEKDTYNRIKDYRSCNICSVFNVPQPCNICPLNDCRTDIREAAHDVLCPYVVNGITYPVIHKDPVHYIKRHYNDLIRKIRKAGFNYE